MTNGWSPSPKSKVSVWLESETYDWRLEAWNSKRMSLCGWRRLTGGWRPYSKVCIICRRANYWRFFPPLLAVTKRRGSKGWSPNPKSNHLPASKLLAVFPPLLTITKRRGGVLKGAFSLLSALNGKNRKPCTLCLLILNNSVLILTSFMFLRRRKCPT